MKVHPDIKAAYECEKATYSELAAECREADWKTTIYPMGVGRQGYVGLSTTGTGPWEDVPVTPDVYSSDHRPQCEPIRANVYSFKSGQKLVRGR